LLRTLKSFRELIVRLCE